MALAPAIGIYKQDPREEKLVEESLREFAEMVRYRSTFGGHWEEVSQLIDPDYRNTFFYQNTNVPGQKKTSVQIDATGMLALNRFASIMDSLLTPRNSKWHGLEASNPYVQKQRGVREYFEFVTRMLFQYRYMANANFSANNQGVYRSLGAYGTGGIFIDAFDGTLTKEKGIRYKHVPVGELFLRQNHQGMIDGFCRWFQMPAYQVWSNPTWRAKFPPQLMAPLMAKSTTPYNFIHRVVPRYDYEPGRLDMKGKPWQSLWISIDGRCIIQEGSYTTFPLPCSRYYQVPGEIYGRGPGMAVLPALKTLNAEKRTFLKQGHRAVDPVYFTADDGIVDTAQMRPGVINKGGVSAEGRLLIQGLPAGKIDISKEMMDEERSLINDEFLVRLFQILEETPQMTATEVIERVNEKGILLAPTVGRQQSEYVGPVVEREIVVLSEQGLLPPMPPALKEARGEYSTIHTSPMTRAMKAGEASGFMRTVEAVKELVSITGDASLLDPFNFDAAVPAIAEIQSVPVTWMATPDQIGQKRKNRAAMQQQEQQIKAAPAQAAIMKAKATMMKATGGGLPGQQPAEGGPPLAEQME